MPNRVPQQYEMDEVFEPDDEAEEGIIGERVILSETGQELGVVKTIGTRPKGSKPMGEDHDAMLGDEDDELIEQFLHDQLEQRNKGKVKVCDYFASGSCRNGTKCTYAHTVEEDGTVYKYNEKDDAECQVCMDHVLATGKQFGVLDGCDHIFCLKCIRSWRATYDKRSTKHHFRTCPICRQTSYLVIPSYYHVASSPSKDYLVEEYKATLATIPCRLFNKGKGECPFRNSCLYEHRGEDGELFEYDYADNFKYVDGEQVEDVEPTLADRMGML